MKIKEITIRRLPGIEDNFTIDNISGGVSLVTGPNGIGKSSICRLINSTLWNDGKSLADSEASILFDDNGNEVRADIYNGIKWQKNGAVISAPELPDSHLKNILHFNLKELINLDDVDKPISEKVRIALSGGFDIHSAKELFINKRGVGKSEAKELTEAKEHLSEVKRNYSELAVDQEKIDDLQSSLQKAKDAEAEIKKLQASIDAVGLNEDLKKINLNLTDLPAGMAKLHGDELNRLKELQESLSNTKEEIETLQQEIESEEEELGKIKLPKETPSVEVIAVKSDIAETLLRLREIRSSAEGTTAGSKKRLSTVLSQIGTQQSTETLFQRLSEKNMSELDEMLNEKNRLESEFCSAETHLEVIEKEHSDIENNPLYPKVEIYDKIKRSIEILRDYLSLGNHSLETDDRTSTFVKAAPIIAFLSLIIGGVAAFLVNPWFSLVAGFGLGVFIFSFSRPKSKKEKKSETKKEILREQFADASGGDNLSWDPESLKKHLSEYESEFAEILVLQAQYSRIKVTKEGMLNTRNKTEAKITELNNAINEFFENAELNIPENDISKKFFFLWMDEFVKAYVENIEAEATFAKADEQYNNALKELQDFLAEMEIPMPDEPSDLTVIFRELNNKINTRNQLMGNIKSFQNSLKLAEKRQSNALQNQNKFISSLGLSLEKFEEELYSKIKLLPEYRELDKKRRELNLKLTTTLEKCDKDVKLESIDIQQLQMEIEKNASLAADAEDIIRQIDRIEVAVEQASLSTKLGNSLTIVEEKKNTVTEVCLDIIKKAGTLYMLEQTENDYRKDNQPPILKAAGDYFRSFTQGLYDLTISDTSDSTPFIPYHNNEKKGYTFEALSDGTRIQLLLALRMAFADQADNNAILPLLLDEPLTTSDPVRFSAIVEALLQLAGAENGRQIFYFSSNPYDIAAWEQIAKNKNITGLSMHDMSIIRTKAISASSNDWKKLELADFSYPSPKGVTAAEFAEKIGVEKLNLYAPVESWHIFYAADRDPELCYKILSLYRTEKIGQFLSIISNESALQQLKKAIGDKVLNKLFANIKLLKSLRKAWQRGRGIPLSGLVFHNCDSVSEKYEEKFANLAEELNWNAKQFIEVLKNGNDQRVSGFRKSKKEEFEEYLLENGFISSEDILDQAELFIAVETECTDLIEACTLSQEDIRNRFDEYFSKT